MTQAIGIFDSGIGGLTVAKAVTELLPNESLIYFGDTAHLPYGDKSVKAINQYALAISKFLLEKNCKMIVIACNTASALAYSNLIEKIVKVPIINVIDPVVEHVASKKAPAKIGVIGTKGTISSDIYGTKIKTANKQHQVYSLATPLLAPMIEAGFFDNTISSTIIENYLSEPGFKDIDVLIPACTHYPLIKKDIEQYYQNKVEVLDAPKIVAQKVANTIQALNKANTGKKTNHHFYISDFTDSFEKTTKLFYQEAIHLEYCPLW